MVSIILCRSVDGTQQSTLEFLKNKFPSAVWIDLSGKISCSRLAPLVSLDPEKNEILFFDPDLVSLEGLQRFLEFTENNSDSKKSLLFVPSENKGTGETRKFPLAAAVYSISTMKISYRNQNICSRSKLFRFLYFSESICCGKYPDLLPEPRLIDEVYTGTNEDLKLSHRKWFKRFFPFPETFMVVLSNRCNLKCKMCVYHGETYVKSRKSDFFDREKTADFERIKKLAREAAAWRPLFHFGELDEPTMYRNFPDLVKYLSSLGIRTHLTSNGQLVSDRMAKRLLEGGLHSVSFSLDAARKETYEQIRIGGNFEKVVNNVKTFIRLRNEIRPRTRVNVCFILQEPALGEEEEFARFWKENGADSVSFYTLFESSGKDGKAHFRNYRPRGTRTPCSPVWMQTFLYPEGETSPCCNSLGNVPWFGVWNMGSFTSSLWEIWHGETYNTLRDALVSGDLSKYPICQGCELWNHQDSKYYTLPDNTLVKENPVEKYLFFSGEKIA